VNVDFQCCKLRELDNSELRMQNYELIMAWEITIFDDSLQPTDYYISSRRASADLMPQAPKVRT